MIELAISGDNPPTCASRSVLRSRKYPHNLCRCEQRLGIEIEPIAASFSCADPDKFLSSHLPPLTVLASHGPDLPSENLGQQIAPCMGKERAIGPTGAAAFHECPAFIAFGNLGFANGLNDVGPTLARLIGFEVADIFDIGRDARGDPGERLIYAPPGRDIGRIVAIEGMPNAEMIAFRNVRFSRAKLAQQVAPIDANLDKRIRPPAAYQPVSDPLSGAPPGQAFTVTQFVAEVIELPKVREFDRLDVGSPGTELEFAL